MVRDINEGEYLFEDTSDDDDRKSTRTLSILGFSYDAWNPKEPRKPQFKNFCAWMKRSIVRGHPVMFGAYLKYCEDPEYDHIMPAVGIEYQNPNDYDPNDVIFFHNLFDDRELRSEMSEEAFSGTRTTCHKNCMEGGCLPLKVSLIVNIHPEANVFSASFSLYFQKNFGIAVTGYLDENHATVPVRLSISVPDEPNISLSNPEIPCEMDAIVTIEKLIAGETYVLLRYSSYEFVPTKGDAEDFLESRFDEKYTFIAEMDTYVYDDPVRIPSHGSTYYRCVSLSGKA